MLIKNRPVQRKKSWTESRLEFYDAKHEVPFIVTVVNDVPIKNPLKKRFSVLHTTRWKNQSQSNSAPTNKEHQPKDALSMLLSRQHCAETVAVSKKCLSSDLGLPTDFFTALR